MELLLSWVVLSLAVWATAELLPGVHLKSMGSAFGVAAIYGVLNLFLGTFLFAALGIVTLGIGFLFAILTRWVVNAIMLTVTDAISDALKIDSFGWALAAALTMSILQTLGESLIGRMF